jgi:dihydropteroate synthase
VTPDSFADGGRHLDASAAVARGVELVRQGAAILDIGGESTRPGAAPVPEAEESRRVLPVIEALARQVTVPLSIDTMKPTVARAALQAGASFVNDVAAVHRGDDALRSSALRRSADANGPDRPKAELQTDAMWRCVAEFGAGYVCMHMQGTPQTMQAHPHYDDVVREVRAFFADRRRQLRAAGVSEEQVVFDPGIGFGKTLAHNLQLLRGLAGFTKLGRPLLLGVSRKSFLGRLVGAEVDARLPGSLASACWAVAHGAHLLRTHDVAETVQAVRVTEALLGQPT